MTDGMTAAARIEFVHAQIKMSAYRLRQILVEYFDPMFGVVACDSEEIPVVELVNEVLRGTGFELRKIPGSLQGMPPPSTSSAPTAASSSCGTSDTAGGHFPAASLKTARRPAMLLCASSKRRPGWMSMAPCPMTISSTRAVTLGNVQRMSTSIEFPRGWRALAFERKRLGAQSRGSRARSICDGLRFPSSMQRRSSTSSRTRSGE